MRKNVYKNYQACEKTHPKHLKEVDKKAERCYEEVHKITLQIDHKFGTVSPKSGLNQRSLNNTKDIFITTKIYFTLKLL